MEALSLWKIWFLIFRKQRISLSETLPDAVGDQTMIIQLYQNLISNAIKYTDKRPRKLNYSRTEKR